MKWRRSGRGYDNYRVDAPRRLLLLALPVVCDALTLRRRSARVPGRLTVAPAHWIEFLRAHRRNRRADLLDHP